MWILVFWKSLKIVAMLMVSGTYFTGFIRSLMVGLSPLNLRVKNSLA